MFKLEEKIIRENYIRTEMKNIFLISAKLREIKQHLRFRRFGLPFLIVPLHVRGDSLFNIGNSDKNSNDDHRQEDNCDD